MSAYGWQVFDNVTGAVVRGGLDKDAAGHLCGGLNLKAGPGGRYVVKCEHGRREFQACDECGRAES